MPSLFLNDILMMQLFAGGPARPYASGIYVETLPSADPFPTSVTWWTDSGKTKKIMEKLITRNANKTPSQVQWKLYKDDGATVLQTITDVITYTAVFETSRTRTIA